MVSLSIDILGIIIFTACINEFKSVNSILIRVLSFYTNIASWSGENHRYNKPGDCYNIRFCNTIFPLVRVRTLNYRSRPKLVPIEFKENINES